MSCCCLSKSPNTLGLVGAFFDLRIKMSPMVAVRKDLWANSLLGSPEGTERE
jgi:hypothetical protein